jgi:hypothetical protein
MPENRIDLFCACLIAGINAARAFRVVSRKEFIENSLCCVGFGLCVFAALTWGLL